MAVVNHSAHLSWGKSDSQLFLHSLKVMDCAPWIPGLTVSVVKDFQTLFARGYGETVVNSNTPVTEQTLFQIGSISKSFAATLLVKQMEDEKYFEFLNVIQYKCCFTQAYH